MRGQYKIKHHITKNKNKIVANMVSLSKDTLPLAESLVHYPTDLVIALLREVQRGQRVPVLLVVHIEGGS